MHVVQIDSSMLQHDCLQACRSKFAIAMKKMEGSEGSEGSVVRIAPSRGVCFVDVSLRAILRFVLKTLHPCAALRKAVSRSCLHFSRRVMGGCMAAVSMVAVPVLRKGETGCCYEESRLWTLEETDSERTRRV
jgi:hypothetical protein